MSATDKALLERWLSLIAQLQEHAVLGNGDAADLRREAIEAVA